MLSQNSATAHIILLNVNHLIIYLIPFIASGTWGCSEVFPSYTVCPWKHAASLQQQVRNTLQVHFYILGAPCKVLFYTAPLIYYSVVFSMLSLCWFWLGERHIYTLNSAMGEFPCCLYLVKHKEANLNMMLAHQVEAEHEPCRRCHRMINYSAARDPVWEQQSYSLCKYGKWKEIVCTHQRLPTTMMIIQWDLTCKECFNGLRNIISQVGPSCYDAACNLGIINFFKFF